MKKGEVCYFKQGKGTGEGRYQNRSLIVLPVLPFYSSCVQSTLIFSLNFHLIGEWHDKRELLQLNGLIETESSEKNPSTLHKKRQFTMWETTAIYETEQFLRASFALVSTYWNDSFLCVCETGQKKNQFQNV